MNKIVIHCADTYSDMDIGAKEIKSWHLQRGWSDIGYHFVIRRNGTIEMGRDRDHDGNILEETGAHVYGHNRNSVGICMVGGKARGNEDPNNFTDSQWESLKTLVFLLHEVHPEAEILGHRDLDSRKECPQFDVKEWWKKVNAEL